MREQSPRPIDRPKVYAGVLLLCAGVVLRMMGKDVSSPYFQALWAALAILGVFFYLWGRFFSRGSD